MINSLRRLTERVSRGWIVAALAVPSVLLMALFNFHPAAVPALLKAGNGTPPLDIQLGYGPADIESLLTTYGTEGRQRYAAFLAVDLVYAVCYGLFLAGLLRLLLRPPVSRADSRWNDLCLLPLFAGAADCVENVSILILIGIYPTVPAPLAYLASTATLVKWTLAAIALLSILVAFVARMYLWATLPRRGADATPR
jgi:hypothetical protein